MVFAGQFRRELSAAEAGGGPGRNVGASEPGGSHVPPGGVVGPRRLGKVAEAAEPAGADSLSPGHGAAPEPQGVSACPPVPVSGVAAPVRRAAPSHPGADRPMDRRRVSRHRAPAGGHLRPVPAANHGPRRSASGPSGVRGKLPAKDPSDGGRQDLRPRRVRGFGQPADGAPFRAAGGADGGDRAALGSAADGGGTGDNPGGPGHGANGAEAGARGRVRGTGAPAAGGFSGVAPRSGAP